ncbi:hypothetical protein ZWY2020_007937, partial [Hordeum vulgare]
STDTNTSVFYSCMLSTHRPSYDANVMGQRRATTKIEVESNPREMYITWTGEATRFMLDWYIELCKDKPTTFKFKQQHHLHCVDALNGKFLSKWGWVRRAMVNSGNDFDMITFTFTLSESGNDEADSHNIDCHSPKVDLEVKSLNRKHKCVSSSPSKKISIDDMAANIKKSADSLASPIVSVQPMPPTNPYTNRWKRINALTIPVKDKLEVVAYLSKPN